MTTFNASFFFRPTTVEAEAKKRKGGMTEAQLLQLVADGKAEKIVETGKPVMFKRKPQAAVLNEPEVLVGITDPLVRELVLSEVKAFVKATVVDVFGELGDHSWAAVSAWREETGRSASDDSIEFTDEDAATVATIFKDYWRELGKDAVGELFAELCTEKCSWASVKKLCTPKGKTITLEIVAKYKDKFAELAEVFKAEQPAEADKLAYLAGILAKHCDKRFVQEDAASAW